MCPEDSAECQVLGGNDLPRDSLASAGCQCAQQSALAAASGVEDAGAARAAERLLRAMRSYDAAAARKRASQDAEFVETLRLAARDVAAAQHDALSHARTAEERGTALWRLAMVAHEASAGSAGQNDKGKARGLAVLVEKLAPLKADRKLLTETRLRRRMKRTTEHGKKGSACTASWYAGAVHLLPVHKGKYWARP